MTSAIITIDNKWSFFIYNSNPDDIINEIKYVCEEFFFFSKIIFSKIVFEQELVNNNFFYNGDNWRKPFTSDQFIKMVMLKVKEYNNEEGFIYIANPGARPRKGVYLKANFNTTTGEIIIIQIKHRNRVGEEQHIQIDVPDFNKIIKKVELKHYDTEQNYHSPFITESLMRKIMNICNCNMER